MEYSLEEALNQISILNEKLMRIEIEHKKQLSEIAKYHTRKVRKLGYSRWSAGHVIEDLQLRSKTTSHAVIEESK